MSRFLPLILGFSVMALGAAITGWAQTNSTPPPLEKRVGKTITVREENRPPEKARVTQVWRLPDGTAAMKAANIESGELLTIVESANAKTPEEAFRVYRWGKGSLTPPADSPIPPPAPLDTAVQLTPTPVPMAPITPPEIIPATASTAPTASEPLLTRIPVVPSSAPLTPPMPASTPTNVDMPVQSSAFIPPTPQSLPIQPTVQPIPAPAFSAHAVGTQSIVVKTPNIIQPIVTEKPVLTPQAPINTFQPTVIASTPIISSAPIVPAPTVVSSIPTPVGNPVVVQHGTGRIVTSSLPTAPLAGATVLSSQRAEDRPGDVIVLHGPRGPERFTILRRVLRQTGEIVAHVQSLTTGEVMTMIEGTSASTVPPASVAGIPPQPTIVHTAAPGAHSNMVLQARAPLAPPATIAPPTPLAPPASAVNSSETLLINVPQRGSLRCNILSKDQMPDGTQMYRVQPIDGGEAMTVIDTKDPTKGVVPLSVYMASRVPSDLTPAQQAKAKVPVPPAPPKLPEIPSMRPAIEETKSGSIQPPKSPEEPKQTTASTPAPAPLTLPTPPATPAVSRLDDSDPLVAPERFRKQKSEGSGVKIESPSGMQMSNGMPVPTPRVGTGARPGIPPQPPINSFNTMKSMANRDPNNSSPTASVAGNLANMNLMTQGQGAAWSTDPENRGQAMSSSASTLAERQALALKNTLYLVNVLQKSDLPVQREWAASRLRVVDPRAFAFAVDALVTAARHDPAPLVRVASLDALGTMGADSPNVLSAIDQARRDADPRVRDQAQHTTQSLTSRSGTATTDDIAPASFLPNR